MNRKTEKYLRTYAAVPARPLVASSLKDIEQAVVIPALAESSSLFSTLASLARNPSHDLRRTLVICVVNNHRPNIATEADIRDNQETLHLLKALVFGTLSTLRRHIEINEDLQQIAESDIRLALIDASSPGMEIPDHDGGVGTARKIGMDAVLRCMERKELEKEVICCLDADTLVEENYLSAVYAHFRGAGTPAAVTAYAHQKPADQYLLAAICCYEIFLRFYVIGLSYAHSPYAFHSIGSTMACTADGYVGVRGMNRRTAAEDFHFLNKLAKIGHIGLIDQTTVFPSARVSGRVPFGTGQRMLRSMTGETDEYRLYDPRIFVIIREWLAGMERDPDRDSTNILSEASQIHPRLTEYLRLNHFDTDWQNIRRNSRNLPHLRQQFHVWFDGLKTMRLVHHLSQHTFPLVNMINGLAGLFDLIGCQFQFFGSSSSVTELDEQLRIVEKLRSDFFFF